MGGSVINGGSYRGDFHASVIPFPIQTDWLRSTYTIQFALFWVSETDKRKKGGVFNPFLTIPNCSRDRPQLGKIGPGPAPFQLPHPKVVLAYQLGIDGAAWPCFFADGSYMS